MTVLIFQLIADCRLLIADCRLEETKLAETKGVHYAREASGHHSDRYIWRYVKPDQQTLADAIDELE